MRTYKGKKEKKISLKKHIHIICILCALVVVINVAAWMAPVLHDKFGIGNWCDAYVSYVTPVVVGSFSRIANLFSFSVGEVMLVLACLLILFMAGACVAGIFFLFKEKKVPLFIKRFYIVFAYIFVIVCLVMSGNCIIFYHTTPLSFTEEEKEYSLAELEKLRNEIVGKCEWYAKQVKRDEEGYLVYEGDMQETAKKALLGLADEFSHLKGYYPRVKHMFFSGLMSQAYMEGYYFPFSMEANCNAKMYLSQYPSVYCHELSHLHGYIYEDEANFLSYLACVKSEDTFFRYCGYLSVLYYVDNAYYDSVQDIERYNSQPQISQRVHDDNTFVLSDTWEEVEEHAILSTETLDTASDALIDTSLNLNGVEDGKASYARVVELLLQYYENAGDSFP